MKTRLTYIDRQYIDMEKIKEAAYIIQKGGLVAFPTETVYGLGADALNKEAASKIYAAKGRPSDNPLIAHIADIEDLKLLAKEVPVTAKLLIDSFWPGPMTLILKKRDIVPDETTGGLDTVAVRMPSDEVAQALIREAKTPVAAPSANLSGRPSPTLARHVLEDMQGRIDMILCSDTENIGLESTIIDVSSDRPIILRPGAIDKDMLEELLGMGVDEEYSLIANEGFKPKAPGMKYRHYAPRAELLVVYADNNKINDKLSELIAAAKETSKKVGIIVSRQNSYNLKADYIKLIENRDDKKDVAAKLFSILREFDELDVDIIYAEAFDESGIGAAIMNRLIKAAGYKCIKE